MKAVNARNDAMTTLSLRRARHEITGDGRAGWVLCGNGTADATDWMVVAEMSGGKIRHIVHENYRAACIAAGHFLDIAGDAFRFPPSVDEWTYDLRSGSLSFRELTEAA